MLRKIKVFWNILFIGFPIGWMALIYYFSSQDAYTSGGMSFGISEGIKGFIESFVGHSLDVWMIDLFLRKSCHFLEYALLYLILYYVLKRLRIKHSEILGIIVCLVYAVSDEFHQVFVQGRGPGVIDVFIDLAGVFFAMVIVKIINFGRIKLRYFKDYS